MDMDNIIKGSLKELGYISVEDCKKPSKAFILKHPIKTIIILIYGIKIGWEIGVKGKFMTVVDLSKYNLGIKCVHVVRLCNGKMFYRIDKD